MTIDTDMVMDTSSKQSGQNRQSQPSHLGHRERIQARILENGADSLSDYEALEALLFFSIPRVDTKDIAKRLLEFDGKQAKKTMGEVLTTDALALTQHPHISDRSVVLFMLVASIAKRMGAEAVRQSLLLDSWQDIIGFCRTTIGHADKEMFLVLYLNAKNRLIAHDRLSVGTIDRVAIYPREVVKQTLTHNASSVVLAHNHPSGETRPSKADIDMTKRLVVALRSIDVILHDHIIISHQDHFSFKNEGLLT
ncbi:MAG: DNA repair protein RadC [Proteobacteria bacterium]|nr:DNA repair protein RadC [Pseudomonadota bacterium]